jgi:pantoate kinase
LCPTVQFFRTFKKVSSGSEKSSKTAVLALKSPTSAHFMSFSMKFTNSFSISKNASIDEYREFSCGIAIYTLPTLELAKIKILLK